MGLAATAPPSQGPPVLHGTTQENSVSDQKKESSTTLPCHPRPIYIFSLN